MPASGNPVAGLGHEFGDKPLSSAILYLAIVAIWACVLVPRWLHRSHETSSEQDLASEQEEAADYADADGPGELATAGAPGEPGAPEFATLREQVVEVTTYVEWEAPATPVATARPARAAAPAGSSREHSPERAGQARLRGPAARQAHVLRARRRMLTILVTLAVAVAAATLVGLAGWWVVTLPAGLLGLYLLLLRVAARSDAENDRRRTEAHARAAMAARERAALAARERDRQAREALPQPIAKIIDISALATQGRDRDQPYDQYADAEVRAVGD
jgi:membrane protein implicated in regulation of membrane protease activity